MKNTLYILLISSIIISCSNNKNGNDQNAAKQTETVEKSKNISPEIEKEKSNNQKELKTELKKEIKFEKEIIVWNEREKKLLKECFLQVPDTSVVGISIDNRKSTKEILGSEIKLGGDGKFRFLTKDKLTYLNLIVHPGAYLNQVSIFEVGYTKDSNDKYDKLFEKTLKTNTLKTEKEIRLGITKSELISKLGDCYKIINNTEFNTTFLYRIEMPQKTKDDFLNRYNMPIYYAEYDFARNKLIRFEFGFEYP